MAKHHIVALIESDRSRLVYCDICSKENPPSDEECPGKYIPGINRVALPDPNQAELFHVGKKKDEGNGLT